MHLGGIRTRVTTSHAESSDLTTALSLQKKEDFPPRREKSARTSSTTLPNQIPPKPTYKISDYSAVNYRK